MRRQSVCQQRLNLGLGGCCCACCALFGSFLFLSFFFFLLAVFGGTCGARLRMSDVGESLARMWRASTPTLVPPRLWRVPPRCAASGAGGSAPARVGGGVSAIAVLALGSSTLTHRRHSDAQAGRVDGPQHSEDVAGACACAELVLVFACITQHDAATCSRRQLAVGALPWSPAAVAHSVSDCGLRFNRMARCGVRS